MENNRNLEKNIHEMIEYIRNGKEQDRFVKFKLEWIRKKLNEKYPEYITEGKTKDEKRKIYYSMIENYEETPLIDIGISRESFIYMCVLLQNSGYFDEEEFEYPS